ncbi:MAG: hypothetical protein KF729_17455, partial [Sandaracinaceae bacterium]|nr:hypothetical protein [Sandaracinaceae bacterium]
AAPAALGAEAEEEEAIAPDVTPAPAEPGPRRARAGLSPAPSLSSETELLRDAHRALQAGAPARALTLLDEHAARFPSGALSEERAATRVLALCEAGREDSARSEAARFLAAHPRSMHAARVRASCTAP